METHEKYIGFPLIPTLALRSSAASFNKVLFLPADNSLVFSFSQWFLFLASFFAPQDTSVSVRRLPSKVWERSRGSAKLHILLDLDLIPKPWRFWKTFQIKRRPALARIGCVWQTSFTASLRSLLSIVVRCPLSNHITVIFYPPVLFVSHLHL